MPSALFITDFDRTLLRDDKQISAGDLAALEKLRETGVVTAIATGRNLFSFNRAVSKIGLAQGRLPVDYLIFSTGAGILDMETGTILRRRSIPGPDVEFITRYFDDCGYDYMVHNAIPDTHHFLFRCRNTDNPDFQRRIDIYQPFSRPMTRSADLYASSTQVLVIINGRIGTQQFEDMAAALSRFSVIRTTSPLDHRSTWIEVFNSGVSKSRAAAWLAGQLKISQSRVVSVGDDTNDQDLLTWSGKGFIVSNGVAGLTDCTRLSASNNQNGVSQAAVESGLLDQISKFSSSSSDRSRSG